MRADAARKGVEVDRIAKIVYRYSRERFILFALAILTMSCDLEVSANHCSFMSCSVACFEGVCLVTCVGLSVSIGWEPFVWRVHSLPWIMPMCHRRSFSFNISSLIKPDPPLLVNRLYIFANMMVNFCYHSLEKVLPHKLVSSLLEGAR